jgi:hypothetical protein
MATTTKVDVVVVVKMAMTKLLSTLSDLILIKSNNNLNNKIYKNIVNVPFVLYMSIKLSCMF